MLSLAEAVRMTVLDTIAPVAGTIRLTVGGVVSATIFCTLTFTEFEAWLPATSCPRATIVWLPFVTVPLFHASV